MCNSIDVVKQDGYYVCQSCGTKYSVEEAKKMMIEGTVDVSGSSVKIDHTDDVADVYTVARRARKDGSWADAEKYYEILVVRDPTSWEAAYYLMYVRARGCVLSEMISSANALINCQESVLTLVRDFVPKDKWDEVISEIVNSNETISRILADWVKRNYTDKSDQDTYKKCAEAAIVINYRCGNEIICVFDSENAIKKRHAVQSFQNGIEITRKFLPKRRDWIDKYENKIATLDPVLGEYTKLEKEISSLHVPNPSDAGLYFIVAAVLTLIGILLCCCTLVVLGVIAILLGILPFVCGINEIANLPNAPNIERQLNEKKKQLDELKKQMEENETN